MTVTREETCFLYVSQAEELFGQALQAHAHASVRRHSVLESCQIAFQPIRCQWDPLGYRETALPVKAQCGREG